MELAARVLTVSDRCAAGSSEDRSGPAVVAALTAAGWHCGAPTVVGDGAEVVRDALVALSEGFTGLVVTTGGTGFAPRDQTPEGTRAVIEREAPGLAEATRAVSELGPLSRGVAGTVGRCVIVNVPGSLDGATESIAAVIDLLPHVVALLAGHGHHHPKSTETS